MSLAQKSRAWISRAWNAAASDDSVKVLRPALVGVAILTLIGLAIAMGVLVVLVLFRAGDTFSVAFLSSAPALGRTLGYLCIAIAFLGFAILFCSVLAVGIRLGAVAVDIVAGKAAHQISSQTEKYLTAAFLALWPILMGYLIFQQEEFQTLPLELRQYLVPLLLPFAVGSVVAPLWGRAQALFLTLAALIAVTAMIVGAGALGSVPNGASGEIAPSPLSMFVRWIDLMREGSAIQRIWWMLLAALAVFVWVIAVFVGFRERRRTVPSASKARIAANWTPAYRNLDEGSAAPSFEAAATQQ